ncbi:nucleotidyltransferase domain-containing protein [Dictyobacter alpinus]|nr:nucleotidyltransferase domain-containing protein [Dictyobacter alpinus]
MKIDLLSAFHDKDVQSALQRFVELYEYTFPGRVAAYYVEGSYADATAVQTSDVDIVVIFRTQAGDSSLSVDADQLWQQLSLPEEIELDPTFVDETSLQEGVWPAMKFGGRLIYGEDICQRYPLLPLVEWTSDRMHAAYWLCLNVYQRPIPFQLPLNFPDPDDEFFGYTRRTLLLSDGTEVPCTRDIIRTSGWAATALLASQAGQYVARKRDCQRLYRQYIGDEWSTLLEDIYLYCRGEWQYLIPADPTMRAKLRAICERMLYFERHFLQLYRPYLLSQFRQAEGKQLERAIWLQENAPWNGIEIQEALQAARQRQQKSLL